MKPKSIFSMAWRGVLALVVGTVGLLLWACASGLYKLGLRIVKCGRGIDI